MAAVRGPLDDDSIATPPAVPLAPLVAGLAPTSGKTIRTSVPGEAIIALSSDLIGQTPPLTWLQDRLDARALGGFRLTGAQTLLVDGQRTAESTSPTSREGQTELLTVSFAGNWPAEHVAAELGRFDGVLWAAPNYRYEGAVAEFVPNDPQYTLQHNYDQINAPAAWDVTLGSPSVPIAVLDMGVELTHPDLKANIWTNTAEASGAAGVDDDGNGFVDDVHGWDFVAEDNDPSPVTFFADSHGTHVAGVAAAMTDNGRGVAGTAGRSTILPLRIYGSDGGFTSTILAQAWKYAADAGVKVANLSYNIDAFVGDPTFTAGLQYFYDHGGLSFTSAGNNSWRDPARQAFEQTLFVVGVDAFDRKSSFSNYGAGMDLAAPAEEIASTVSNRDYGYSTGTSGASPQAAGVAALIWAAHPNYTRDQVAAALLGSTDDIDALNPRFAGQLGSGRLNAGRAVATNTLPAPRIESLDGLPANGATVDQRTTIDGFDLSFDQVMDSTTVNTSANWDLHGAGLDGLFDTSDDVVYSLQSSQYMVGTNRLHVAIGPTALSTGAHRLTLSNRLANPFGVKLDGNNDGVGGDSYVRTFTVGLATPRQLAPEGSLIHEAPVRGVLTSAGVIDRYRYQLDAGQTLTVRLTPSAALRGQVNVTSPVGTQLGAIAAAAPGDEVVLQTLRIDSAGEYEVAVSGLGGTSGGYSLELFFNAAIETEKSATAAATNNTLQTAQDLSSSFVALSGGASRGAVLGGVVTDVVEDGFESNDFKALPWQTSGDAPWTITAADSRTGAFSAVSGSIGDNEQSSLSLKTTTGAGLVRFARRVSSEYAFDVLIFAVDGIERGRWSGKNQGFVDESFEVEAGTHTFSWTYQKDYGAIDGTDQAFIDDIELPVVADPADWYRLSLTDGQKASVALTQFAGVPTRLELYDSAGRLLAVGNSAANVDQRIDGYRDSTVDGGATDYFVRVETLDDYSLVVTRGVEFEVEPNDASGGGGASRVGDSYQSGAAILGAIDDRDSSITKLARDFAGQSLNDTTCGCEPPDTHAAVGLHHVVEVVNSAVAIYTKDGAKVGQSIELTNFFRSDIVAGETFLFDPIVAYDESLDRWIVAALSAADGNATESDLLYAVSNSDDPTGGWAEQHRIDFHGASPGYFADYPKIGWNADSHVFTFNMFGLTGVYVDVLAIDKASVIDGNSATFAARISTRMRNDFTMAVATMHDATPDGPMWFVEENSYGDGEFIRLVRMDRVNSDSPRFTDFTVRVAGYSATPGAVQPGGTFTTNDSRMLNAELRGGRLVATHTVGLAGDATARWYEFDVSSGVPTLKQQGNIRPGPGVSTYYPSIAINAAGDIGMTYMQSSADEFVSMYVTGQKAGGPSGVMGAPALVKAGETTYLGRRGGDYSGTTVDPVTDAFWSANEVVLNGSLWSTWIAGFNVEQIVDKDTYVLNATAGDQLSIRTTTPFDAPLLVDNRLDPRLELIDPSGSVVAVDDNSAGDGRNSAINFTATQTGSYRLRASGAAGTAGASGEYLLAATGMTGTTNGPAVVSSQPIGGLKTKALPKTYELDFSTQLLATSIDPQDLLVGGRPALAARLLDGRRLQFDLDPATNAGDGVYPVTLAAGALTDLAGRGNSAYAASLTIDATGPHVIATTWNGASLAADKVLPVGGVDFTAKFDEPLMAIRSARRGLKLPGVDDVSLTNRTTGEVTRPQAVDYDFANAIFSARFATLAEGPYRLRLASNGDAFADQVGNPLDGEPNLAAVDGTPSGDGAPGGDYWIDFAVDAASLTAKPFERIEPLGGQASASRGNLGYLDGAADVDTVKFHGRAGQKVSIAATPGAAVVLSGQLVGVSGVFTATASGAKLILPSLTLPTDGDYEFRLSGDGAAAYEVELLSGGAFDSEPNDSRAAAQSLDAAFLSSGAAGGTSELAVVVGSLDVLVGSGGSPTGPQAAGGGDSVDWYSLALDAGQSLSVSLAGAGVVRLFNASGVRLAAGVDVSTDLAQSINGFVAPAAGTYFVQVADAEAGTSGDGDYTLVVGRGGDFEVEPNDRLAIAQRLEGAKSIAGWLNGTPPAAYQAGAWSGGDGSPTDGDGGNQAGGGNQTGGAQRNGTQGDAVSVDDAARTRRGAGDVPNAGNANGGANGSTSSDSDADRRVIVRFDDGLPDELVEQWVASRGGRIVTRLHSVFNGAVVELPDSAAESTEVARDWSKAPNVAYAVADMRRTLAVVPDDPQFAQQWGFDNQGQTGGAADADVDAPEAWDYVTGSADVVVAVIDTGIDYRHPDLAANMWVNPGEVPNNKLDDDGNGYVDDVYGIDAAADDSDPQDFFGHGTHVAGTIAAVTNNGIGVAGVNWNAKVMAVKAFSDGGFAYDADLIEALDYVVMMKRTYGVNIVATNNSYGGGGFNPAMVDAIRASVDAGVLFVAAAGNASTDIDVVPFYPAGYALDGIVSVAATDHADHLAWFSNYGATGVDLAAPGDGILSTVPGGDYAVYSGTSMATPHVAGAVALLAANSPGASAADLKRALLQSVDFASDLDGAVATDGRLNLLRALQQLGDRGDYYRFKATAGDQLLLTTSTSTSADVAPDRQLDPALELYDSHGVLVASDDNSAADGRNSRLAFLATESGDYVVHVVSRANRGEYVLQLQGATGEDVAPIVVATAPLDAERVPSVPQRYTIDFSEALLVSSVQPSDLEFGGRPALAVEVVDGDTLSFTPDASVDTGADRFYDVTIAAGAMIDLQGVPNAAFQATVFIDHTAPRVVATRWNGAAAPANRTFAEGPMSVEFQFSEPVRQPLGVAAWLWSDRFGLSITPVNAILDAGGTMLHLDFESLAEGRYELKLASGDKGVQDLAGNDLDGEPSAVSVDGAPSGDGVAGGDFTASFEVDRTQVDARPMQRLAPAGSLIVESRFNDGWLNFAGDEDVYRVFAQQGETLAVSVVSTGGAIPAGLRVRIDGLTDWSSSPQPTDAAMTPPTRAPGAGYYFVRVTGDRAASYLLNVARNAAIEWPEGDSRANWPVALASSAIELETWASRQAVVGMSLPPGLVGGEKNSSIGPNVTEDLDQYQLDFTDSVGHSVDIMLASEFGVFGAERLELLDPTGVNVLATAAANPLNNGIGVTNYDLAIRDFVAPTGGVYTLRLISKIWSPYEIVVTDHATFDDEPNDRANENPIRSLTATGAALGMLGGEARVYFDRDAFLQAFDGLVTESFEAGRVTGNAVIPLPSTLDATSSNDGFSPGEIASGLQIAVTPNTHQADGLGLFGPEFTAQDSTLVGAYWSDEDLELRFTRNDVYTTGMRLGLFDFSDGAGAIGVFVYGLDDELLYSDTVYAGPEGTFWGISLRDPIERVRVASLHEEDPEFELIDDISFGGLYIGQDRYQASYEAGTIAVVTATAMFNDPGSDVPNHLAPQLSLIAPDGSTVVASDLNSDSIGSASIVWPVAQTGVYTIAATAKRGSGEYVLRQVMDHLPIADAGSGYVVNEQGQLQLDGTKSRDIDVDRDDYVSRYEWDLDGDGVFGESGVAAARGDEVGAKPTFSAAGIDGPATRAVKLRVYDRWGQMSGVSNATIQIANAAPTAAFVASRGDGAPVRIVASLTGATDVSSADVAAGLRYSIVQKASNLAASYAAASGNTTATFNIATAGVYPVFGRVWDKDGGFTDYQSSVLIDLAAPTSRLVAPGVSMSGFTTYFFSVIYTDDVAIDTATIDSNDIVVTGPQGFRQAATLAQVDSFANGALRTATYRITPPGGMWTAKANGNYTVTLQNGQVLDGAGRTVAGGSLGGFSVKAGLDFTAPRATVVAGSITDAASGSYNFTVTYTDNVEIKNSSLDGNDIIVAGPNGYSQRATLVSATPAGGSGTVTAVYQVAAPAAGWTSAFNGAFAVNIQTRQVQDTNGNWLLPGKLGQFVVDTVAPKAVLSTTSPLKTANATSYAFTVTYSDNSAIRAATIDGRDIRVTGPNGFNQPAKFVSVNLKTDGTPRVANYSIVPSSGKWTWVENGTYTISVEPDQVTDTYSRGVPAGSIGTFAVSITPPKITSTAQSGAIRTGVFESFDGGAIGLWRNSRMPEDVDGRDGVTPTDVLLIVNHLNSAAGRLQPLLASSASDLGAAELDADGPYLDVNGDGAVTPQDALLVVNYLNATSSSAAGEAATGDVVAGLEWSAPTMRAPTGASETNRRSDLELAAWRAASAANERRTNDQSRDGLLTALALDRKVVELTPNRSTLAELVDQVFESDSL